MDAVKDSREFFSRSGENRQLRELRSGEVGAKYQASKVRFMRQLINIGIFAGIAFFAVRAVIKPSTNPIRPVIQSECVIKGNISISNGKQWYHLPGMEDYERTRIDISKGERWFCTEQEAIAAGWKKAPR